MTAQEILKLVEEVDPADAAKLDEIDARVWCFVENKYEWSDKVNFGPGFYMFGPKFTRSRDALKAIRPQGWKRIIIQGFPCSGWSVEIYDGAGTPNLPTEELAELHAIIQAIEYERNNK